jgi:hypothetical protein
MEQGFTWYNISDVVIYGRDDPGQTMASLCEFDPSQNGMEWEEGATLRTRNLAQSPFPSETPSGELLEGQQQKERSIGAGLYYRVTEMSSYS